MIKLPWLLYFFLDISFPTQKMKENAGSVMPKETRPFDLISFLHQSWSIDCLKINRERENRRVELVGSAARPVQLTIKKSLRTLIHGEAIDGGWEREKGEEEEKQKSERRSWQIDQSVATMKSFVLFLPLRSPFATLFVHDGISSLFYSFMTLSC